MKFPIFLGIERSTLVRPIKNGAFDHCLNLDLKALELGFRLYLKDPTSGFSKAYRLNQKIVNLAATFCERVKEALKTSLSFSFMSWMNSNQLGLQGDFLIHVYPKKVFLFTPFQVVRIEDDSPEKSPLPRNSLMIADLLITYLDATLFSANTGAHACELLRSHSSDHKIGKITNQELYQLQKINS